MYDVKGVPGELGEDDRKYLAEYFKNAPAWLMNAMQIINIRGEQTFSKWLRNDINAYRMQTEKTCSYLLEEVRKERLYVLIQGVLFVGVGVAIFIVVDIGVDPFTGIVLVICDKIKKEYRYVKIGFDISMIILGTVLGGTLGAVTVITALAGGPVVQFYKNRIERLFWIEKMERG